MQSVLFTTFKDISILELNIKVRQLAILSDCLEDTWSQLCRFSASSLATWRTFMKEQFWCVRTHGSLKMLTSFPFCCGRCGEGRGVWLLTENEHRIKLEKKWKVVLMIFFFKYIVSFLYFQSSRPRLANVSNLDEFLLLLFRIHKLGLIWKVCFQICIRRELFFQILAAGDRLCHFIFAV